MSTLVINTYNTNQSNNICNNFVFNHSFPKWAYEKAGFTCRHRLFKSNVFFFNGRTCTCTEADRLMKMMGWTIRESSIERNNGLIIRETRIYLNGKLMER